MSIASRIESIEGHIEQAYDELQGLGADLTGIDKNIDNIASVLDDIYDDLPKVTGSGTSITLDDTRKGRVDMEFSGNTSQYTTTGKNLNIYPYVDTTKTTNGITWTDNGDGTLTVNGTNSGTATAYFNMTNDTATPITLPAGTYTASLGCVSNVRGTIARYDNMNTVVAAISANTNAKTFTLAEETQLTFILAVNKELSTNNVLIKPMIELGNTATEWEEYSGGIASPNPSYPQPVNVVSGDNKIVINSKNLFAGGNTTTHNGITFTKNNDGSYNIVGTATSTAYLLNYVPLEESGIINGETYTISLNQTVQNLELRIESYNGNTWLRATMGGLITFPKTHSADVTDATSVRFGLFVQSGKTVNITNLKIMLEKGSSASSYLPCSRDTYNIDLPVENLWGGFSNSFSRTDLGVQFTANQDGTITANGTATNIATSILLSEATSNGIYKSLPKGTYTVSGGGTNYTIEVYDKDNVVRLAGIAPSGSSVSFTLNANTNIVLRIQVASGVTINETIKLQLEKGSKTNTYTPYGTTPIELCKIGNYQDYFYKDSDKWYLHKEIGKIDISNYNNTEPAGAWSGFEPNGNICMIYNNTGVKITPIRNDVLSNKFAPQAESMWNGMRVGIQSYANDSKIVIGTTIAEVEEYAGTTLNVNNYIGYFKTYIISLKPDIYIILATPTNEEITYQPLIDQLNLLEKAMSKDGQTNISQVNNDLPFIISASALKEWQESTSLNSTLSMANPLSLGNTLNTQENDIQPIEVDNIEPLEEEENE